MISLVAAFRAVIDQLEQRDIPYVVVGSTAAASWGVARSTRDVDLVTVLSPDQLEALLSAFAADLYVLQDQARRAVEVNGSFNVLHLESGGKVAADLGELLEPESA